MQSTFPNIVRGGRVVHKLYGRGVVVIVHRQQEQAGVKFDGESVPRRVWMRHLANEPGPVGRPALTVVRRPWYVGAAVPA